MESDRGGTYVVDYKKIATLDNEVEANLLSLILEKEQIPHTIKSYHDIVYDGIFQLQKGWGSIISSPVYEKKIVEILTNIRAQKSYDIILFDLDGTLTNSKEGITKSVQYALSKFDIHEEDLDKLEPFIGPPLIESFQKFYGFDTKKANQAVGYYREYFAETGIFENKLYSGISKLLAELKENKKRLVIATSKPTVFTEKILKYFDIYSYFELIVGSNLDGTRSTKSEVIEYALSKLEGVKNEDIVMVGDRSYDIKGAAINKIDSIAVTYGFGSQEEIRYAKPNYIVDSVEELKNLLFYPILNSSK